MNLNLAYVKIRQRSFCILPFWVFIAKLEGVRVEIFRMNSKISSSYILDKSVDNPINFLAIFFSNAVGRLNGSNLKKQRWIK